MLTRSRPYMDADRVIDAISAADLSDESHITDFEKKFSRYLGTHTCFATNQSRAGLLLAFKAMGIAQGDEVIVQSFTFRGVMNAILESGAVPVLADSCCDDLHAHPEEIESRITDRTKAIIATHLFGVPCDIEEYVSIARERDCFLIEDCAQCLGAAYNGKKIGTFGDVSTFSFNFEKHMSTGEGGMVAVNTPSFADRVRETLSRYAVVSPADEKSYVYGLLLLHHLTEKSLYRTNLSAYFGQDTMWGDKRFFRLVDRLVMGGATSSELHEAVEKYIQEHAILQKLENRNSLFLKFDALKSLITMNYLTRIDNKNLLMNTMRAVVGSLHLDTIDDINRIRNENAKTFAEMLEKNENFQLPVVDRRKSPVFLKYNVLNRTTHTVSAISARALQEGMELSNYQWQQPVHRAPILKRKISHKRESLKTSERIAADIINLPVHYSVKDEDIERIVGFLYKVAGTPLSEPVKQNIPVAEMSPI
jgi:perosamine synthetase